MNRIKIAVCGAAGKMGKTVIKGICGKSDLQLVEAIDLQEVGTDAGLLAGIGPLGVPVLSGLQSRLAASKPDVMIDFTAPETVMKNIYTALTHGVVPVVGTTGLNEADLSQVRKWVADCGIGAIIAPNFSIGAVLMMRMARLCARYLPDVEIVELHHDGKVDAPSGTAIKTAKIIREAVPNNPEPEKKIEVYPGARGAMVEGIPIHSIRLPGLVAHQKVIFGGIGQVITIQHDSNSRDSFIPGLLMAVRRARSIKKLVYGIEELLEF
jgi:4-hydroxy-tetrahydrodipicolinate reductase